MLLPEIKRFLKCLKITDVVVNGEWAQCRCPLAPWLHAGGRDNNPSFGVFTAKSNADTRYNCFTCGGGPSLSELLARLHLYHTNSPRTGVAFDFRGAQDVLHGLQNQLAPIPDWEEHRASAYAEFEEWPQWFVDRWTPAHYTATARKYLASRGVDVEMSKAQDLRYDPIKNMVVAPYRNMFGRLAGARGRSLDPECPKAFRHFDYTWNGVNNNHLVWCGEPVLMAEKPVVVVEGQFDRLNVLRVYPHVLAQLSTKVTEYKQQKLLHAPGVVIFCDDDQPGRQAAFKLERYLQHHKVPVVQVAYPAAPVGDDGQPRKQDPAGLSIQQLRAALEPFLELLTP